MNDYKSTNISFLELLLWFVVIASIISIASLVLDVFKPKLILVATALMLSVFFYFKDVKLDFHINKRILDSLIVLIFVALFFRIDKVEF